jgi:hypothetical protein
LPLPLFATKSSSFPAMQCQVDLKILPANSLCCLSLPLHVRSSLQSLSRPPSRATAPSCPTTSRTTLFTQARACIFNSTRANSHKLSGLGGFIPSYPPTTLSHLILLPATTGAACLDGSPYGFYFAPSTKGSSMWTVSIEGGGWCYDEVSCLARANTSLGSSHFWPPTAGCTCMNVDDSGGAVEEVPRHELCNRKPRSHLLSRTATACSCHMATAQASAATDPPHGPCRPTPAAPSPFGA